MSSRNYNRKSFAYICITFFIIIVIILIIGMLFFETELILIITVPLLILIIISYIVIRFSWQSQKYCPRCNIPVSIYADFCKNCGLKLISRCPNCDKYIKEELGYCRFCGYSFEYFEKVKETPEYIIVERGSPAPVRPNFCPACGTSLKNAESLRFCEYCGSKLV
jgi:predicted amidophosphoribosyltransferase